MTKTSKSVIAYHKNCIATEDSECQDCDLDGLLICRFDKQFARKFMLGNTLYRLLAIAIFVLSCLLIGHWWMLPTYVGILILTFFVIEPRLFCSHCPYYELEGKYLKCWALRGMPKIWKYRPEPISKWEKYLMLVFGTYIDLFPFVGLIWGIVEFARNAVETLNLGIGISVVGGLFIIVAIIFAQVLLGMNCKLFMWNERSDT